MHIRYNKIALILFIFLFSIYNVSSNIAPLTPTNFHSYSSTLNSVSLAWTASIGATSYNLYRSNDNAVFYLILTTSSTTQSGITGTYYIDAGLVPDTTYYYKLEAVNSAGRSPVTDINAKTLGAPISPTSPTTQTTTTITTGAGGGTVGRGSGGKITVTEQPFAYPDCNTDADCKEGETCKYDIEKYYKQCTKVKAQAMPIPRAPIAPTTITPNTPNLTGFVILDRFKKNPVLGSIVIISVIGLIFGAYFYLRKLKAKPTK
jgi:hypothetical protein